MESTLINPDLLVTVLSTSISVIFVAVTFFIATYEQVRDELEGKWLHYHRSIRIMNYALILAASAFLISGLSIFGMIGSQGYLIATVLLGLELGLLIVCILYVSQRSLKYGLFPR